jgi:hypothetical protein
MAWLPVIGCASIDGARRGGGAVPRPVGAQRHELALVVDLAGDHDVGGDLLPAHGDDEVPTLASSLPHWNVSRKLNSILSVLAIAMSQNAEMASRPR